MAEGPSAADPPSILHVDMDAFFASVEVLDNPSLLGLPVIVGGTGDRGVVAACTYEARASGVRSAMPMVKARQLCPNAVILSGRFSRYQEVSAQVHLVFHEVTDAVEAIGLDEAFLDVRPARRRLGDSVSIAHHLRQRILEETGLVSSVGIGQSKMIAKLASRRAKPQATSKGVKKGLGVAIVLPDDEEAFLRPLPIRALWGIGPAMAERLYAVGVSTVGELADLDASVLRGLLGSTAGAHLHELSHGRDPDRVTASRPMKSISQEMTFAIDCTSIDEARAIVVDQAERVATSLRSKGMKAKTISVKARYGDFQTVSRAFSVELPIDAGKAIAKIAQDLLDAVPFRGGFRLLGVSASGLQHVDAEQLAFFGGTDTAEAIEASWSVVDETVDAIRARFGATSVGLARDLSHGKVADSSIPRPERWGPTANDVS
ncbi:MAG: DNA polymerase IV [Actinomycetota bacterium]